MERGKLVGFLLALTALAGCSKPGPPITVGSKTSTEQAIVGEIVAQQIERKLGTHVERRLNAGGTLLLHESLMLGQVDVYPEDAASALSLILKLDPEARQDVAWERLRQEYGKLQLIWMSPLGYNTGYALMVRGPDARAERLATISDAVRYTPGWKIAVPPEFWDRRDCPAVLMRTYGLPLASGVAVMDPASSELAMWKKQINMVAASLADYRGLTLDWKALRDDKSVLPPSRMALAVRTTALREHPGLQEALDSLTGKISLETIRKLGVEVGSKRRPAAEVAREFLNGAGL